MSVRACLDYYNLWLYVRGASHAAERACIDIKNKRSPQAMERVLWTKGLKEILKVDRAFIVTTDNRPEIRDFATLHEISILQGEFLKRAISAFPLSGRLSEEDFMTILKAPCIVDPRLDWRGWFKLNKARLLDSLNFDGCNSYLLGIRLLLDEYIASNKLSEISLRLLYINVAFFLICLDYTSRSFIQFDTATRTILLTNGFRYGEAGHQRTDEVVEMALQLLADSGEADLFSSSELHKEFERQVSEYRAEILGEYFAKTESLKNLFPLARDFEEQAYSTVLLKPHEIPSEQKAVLAIFCDFLGYDRKEII